DRALLIDRPKNGVLLRARQLLEPSLVPPLALEGDLLDAVHVHSNRHRRGARRFIQPREELDVARAGKLVPGGEQPIQHRAKESGRAGFEHARHPRFLASRRSRSAIRSATAWMVDVGLTAPPVVMTLPSMM